MTTKRIIIDSTDKTTESRIVRETALNDLWDAGVADNIMSRRNGQLFEVQTIGQLLGELIEDLQATQPDLVATLDRFTVESFIRDMSANGYNIAFTDELPYGRRLAPPTVNTVTPSAGSVEFNVTFEVGDDVTRLYVSLIRSSDSRHIERKTLASIDGTGLVVESVNVPIGTYTGFVAGIDSQQLRGFKSTDIPPFSVT